jgi:aspartyl protease family protein
MSDPQGPWHRPPRPPQPTSRRPRRLALGLALAACAGLGLWGLTVLNPTRRLSGEDWLGVSYALGFMALISASLFARRLRFGQVLRYTLIWLAIVAALLLGFSFRDELGFVGRRLMGELAPSQPLAAGPREMVLTQEGDGHFYVMGTVNGTPVRFLIDTGASGIALSPADARRLGIDLAGLTFSESFETANGVGRGAPFIADGLSVGPLHMSDVAMSINQAPMRASLLGLSYLRELESFEVRGRRLYLRWRA